VKGSAATRITAEDVFMRTLPAPKPQTSLRERFNLSAYALQHPWLTLGFWIAVMVAGLLAFSSLKYALLPAVAVPIVLVDAASPQVTVAETTTQLTAPIEQKLRGLPRLEPNNLRSTTYPGRTVVSLAFKPGTSLERANAEVTTALAQVAWPQGSSHKLIPIDLNEAAVVSYALTSQNLSLTETLRAAQTQIIPQLARLPGVHKVEILGLPSSDASPPTLQTHGLQTRGSQAEVNLVEPGTSAVRYNAQPALALAIIKQRDANALDVAEQVAATVKQLQGRLEQVQLTLATTQAQFIQESNQATLEALILAILLSIVVIWPFLRDWRATLISALAIPTSLLGTFIVLAAFGFNLDTITLLALALVIGIIVDDAIVDVENISRHLQAGVPAKTAAIEATQEIGLTVTAATFTIVAVFLPVGLMQGPLGQFFRPFGLTVSAAVVISLLVARTLSPLLAARWLRPDSSRRQDHEYTLGWGAYRQLLAWSLQHRGWVLGLALASFLLGVGLLPVVPKGFMPPLDRGEFLVSFSTPLPTASSANLGALLFGRQSVEDFNPLTRTTKVGNELANVVRQSPQVATVLTTIGDQGRPNAGTLHVTLHPRPQRQLSTKTVEDQVRQQLPKLAGVKTSVTDLPFVNTAQRQPLSMAFVGADPLVLKQTAERVQSQLQSLGEFQDLTLSGTSFTEPNPANPTAPSQVAFLERLEAEPVVYLNADLREGVALGHATEQAVEIARQQIAAVSEDPKVSQNPTSRPRLQLGGNSAQMQEVFADFGGTIVLACCFCCFGIGLIPW
jgi:multidrug efflux pump subunit AcrB